MCVEVWAALPSLPELPCTTFGMDDPPALEGLRLASLQIVSGQALKRAEELASANSYLKVLTDPSGPFAQLFESAADRATRKAAAHQEQLASRRAAYARSLRQLHLFRPTS